MDSVWFNAELSDEIMKYDDINNETHNIVTDIVTAKLDIARLVENLAGILTNKDPENRAKGMKFFTKVLNELPKSYLSEMQVKFISKFYTDRLKDNHRVIPSVLEGYLSIVAMDNYCSHNCGEFLTTLFREVPCQSQVRQDRYNIYTIIETLLNKHLEYLKTIGPDFIYGVISAMDGERDPRNLLYLFSILPKLMKNIPLGHLVEEMFAVISCYYPIDFHASPDDPAAVTRQQLADALAPGLCAVPEFGEQCLVLLIEKLDSSLRLAKLDSLKLLAQSFDTFPANTYKPFVKALWSSIRREISHKTDDELKLMAHETLSLLVKKLSTTANTDQAFENFVKAILISMQTAIAESTTAVHFNQASRILLTTANASKESCIMVAKSMIPASIAYYGFKMSPKLQISCLAFLGDVYEVAKHWEVLDKIDNLDEIPQLCLTAVSEPNKEYQIAGFKLLIRIKNLLKADLVPPVVEILIHNIQHVQDNDVLTVSIEAVHSIARSHPKLIMNLVVRGKCDLDNITRDKSVLNKRLTLLSNLASIDEFTTVIIEEMLKIISLTDKQDAQEVVKAINVSMSDSDLYSEQKVVQIDSDHGLIDSIVSWLMIETSQVTSIDSLTYGYSLIATTLSSLPEEKQYGVLKKHAKNVLEKCTNQELYYLILHSLYSSLRQNVYDDSFKEIMYLSCKVLLETERDLLRGKACTLVAHFLNKAEYGERFDTLYEIMKETLSSCDRGEEKLCPKLIALYGWLTKALIMRGNSVFLFWLKKIITSISSPELCNSASESIKLIMTDFPDRLNMKCHCRVNFLYKQRFFQTFMHLTEKFNGTCPETKKAFLSSWAHVLKNVSKNLLINHVDRITPLVIDSLDYDNQDMLVVMLGILSHLVQSKHQIVPESLQTILPRLVNLSKYTKSMDVRISSLQCLYDIANTYSTVLLLPYKQDVLLDLAPSLDDKKRLVRSAAVRSRTRWFLIGSPGENKAD